MRRTTTPFALSLLLTLAVALPVSAIPLYSFRSRVQAAAQAALELRQASERPGTVRDADVLVARIREQLPPGLTVETDQGQFEVDLSWVERGLQEYDEAPSSEARGEIAGSIAGRLQLLRDHLEGYAGKGGASASEREKLQEILARSEFRDPAQDPMARLVRRVRDYIVEFFQWIQETLFGGENSSTFAAGVRSLVLVGALVAAVLLGRTLWRLLYRREPEGVTPERTVLGEKIGAHETAGTLAEAARALAAAGEYRAAIRKLFVAQLYGLAERNLVALAEEKTNREYLAQVRALGEVYPILAAMTDMFERVWYGGHDADKDDYEAFLRHYETAERALATSAEPASV